MCGLVCDHGWSADVIGIHGGKAMNETEYRKEKRCGVISVQGDSPRDHSVARSRKGADGKRKARVCTVVGHTPVSPRKMEDYSTLSVVGATPRDLSIDKADQRAKVKTMTVTGSTAQ